MVGKPYLAAAVALYLSVARPNVNLLNHITGYFYAARW